MDDIIKSVFCGIVVIGLLLAFFRKLAKKNSRKSSQYKYRPLDSETKGQMGESFVIATINRLAKNILGTINNFTFEYDEKTCQIDHLVFNNEGIFVIETKNYIGRIYGNENGFEWTQVTAYGKVKYKFYNPIKQNATHIYLLKKKFNINIELFSAIVFTENNVQLSSPYLYNVFKLAHKINENKKNYSDEEILDIYNKLIEYQSTHHIQLETHITRIKAEQIDITRNICPRCGGKLVLRKGKYGEFYGCENYPNCKFTKN